MKNIYILASAVQVYKTYMKTKDEAFISEALLLLQNAHQDKLGNFSLSSLYIILALETDHIKQAKEAFSHWKSYKNYLKNNEPFYYTVFLYFSYRFGDKQLIFGQTDKYKNAVKEETLRQENGFSSILMADISIRENDLKEAARWLQDAHYRGARSPFLFFVLEKFFLEEVPLEESKPLLLPFLTWALAEGITLTPYIEHNERLVKSVFPYNPSLFMTVYEKTETPWLLEHISLYFAMQADTSKKAFTFYQQAVQRQLDTPSINEFLLKSAFKNEEENIPPYAVGEYLTYFDDVLDKDMKPFIYHLILTNPDFSIYLERTKNDILDTTLYAIQNKLSGKYYNSLYTYFVKEFPTHELAKVAMELLLESLFKIEIFVENEKAAWILIKEPEKKEMATYPVINNKSVVSAIGEQFSYHAYSKEKELLNTNIIRKLLVVLKDIDLLLQMYEKGVYSNDLLIALSLYYIDKKDLSETAITILEKTIDVAQLKDNLQMEISATLGLHYCQEQNYKKALFFYTAIQDNQISQTHLDYILMAYIKEREFTKAIRLIQRKSEWISDKNLFYAVKTLLKEDMDKEALANISYELLLKNRFDRELLQLVLEYYHGSISEWQDLNKSLMNMQYQEKGLDVLILELSIYTNTYNVGIEQVFLRMAKNNLSDPLVLDMAMFFAYHILIENAIPINQVIYVLEDMLGIIKDKNDFLPLALALCQLYIKEQIWTNRQKEILQTTITLLEKEDILLPIFKEMKDKSLSTSYIDKNEAFLYRTHKNRKVVLYYKPKGKKTFYKKPMTYLRFGVFSGHFPVFFGEEIVYYISEKMPSGSIETKEESIKQTKLSLKEERNLDFFDRLNNAYIYKELFQYENAEKEIEHLLVKKSAINEILDSE